MSEVSMRIYEKVEIPERDTYGAHVRAAAAGWGSFPLIWKYGSFASAKPSWPRGTLPRKPRGRLPRRSLNPFNESTLKRETFSADLHWAFMKFWKFKALVVDRPNLWPSSSYSSFWRLPSRTNGRKVGLEELRSTAARASRRTFLVLPSRRSLIYQPRVRVLPHSSLRITPLSREYLPVCTDRYEHTCRHHEQHRPYSSTLLILMLSDVLIIHEDFSLH